MKKVKHFKKFVLLVTCVLIIAPRAGFGALNDEMTAVSSSINGPIMNNDAKISEEAKRLAASYSTEVIPFTKAHARTIDRPGRCILLRAIAQLPDKSAVQDALYGLAMSESGLVHEDVITAISYCNPDEIVTVAFRIAKDAKSRQAGNSALALLQIFGNSATVSSLEQLEKSVDDKQFKKEIAAARQNIADRMNSSEATIKDWDRYALPYWRVPREVTLMRSVVMTYFLRAELLNKRGYRFSGAFLKDRFNKNEPLAAALLAIQKESGFVNDLKMHLSDESIMKEMCRLGIAHIDGTQTIDFTSFFNSN